MYVLLFLGTTVTGVNGIQGSKIFKSAMTELIFSQMFLIVSTLSSFIFTVIEDVDFLVLKINVELLNLAIDLENSCQFDT